MRSCTAAIWRAIQTTTSVQLPVTLARCKVAQAMRRRLAVLADLSKPSEERWDAMRGIVGSEVASRLAGELQGE